jgi:hypothetical protein
VCPTLFAIGLFFEVFGAGLVAAPELAPPLTWVTRKLLATRLVTRLRLLIRGPRHIVMDAEPGAYLTFGMRTSGRTLPPDDASDERKLAWLLTQVREMQEQLDTMQRELEEEPTRRQEEIEKLRAEFETHVTSEIKRESELYLTLRRLGVVLVILGVILTGVANFV